MYILVQLFYAIIVALAVGAVSSIVLLFSSAFLFAGDQGEKWVVNFFGTNNGQYFYISTFVIGLIAFKFTRKMNIVSSAKK